MYKRQRHHFSTRRRLDDRRLRRDFVSPCFVVVVVDDASRSTSRLRARFSDSAPCPRDSRLDATTTMETTTTMKTTRAGRDTRTRAPPTPTTPTPTRLFAPSLVRVHHRPAPSRSHHHPSPSRARVLSPMRAMRAMRTTNATRTTRTTTTRDTETAHRLHPTHRPLVESRHHRAHHRDPSIHQ